jgi:hypothetical protein
LEEEGFPYPTLFFLQTANISNPKREKQRKPQTSKCNCNPSSSITQKFRHDNTINIQDHQKQAESDFTKLIRLPNANIFQFYS